MTKTPSPPLSGPGSSGAAGPKTHTISLTNGALAGLRMILTGTGWCKDGPEAMIQTQRACELVESILPEPEGRPEQPEIKTQKDAQDYDKAFVAWEKLEAGAVELTEKKRDTCKLAVTWAVKNGALPNGRHKLRLMRELGLLEKDS